MKISKVKYFFIHKAAVVSVVVFALISLNCGRDTDVEQLSSADRKVSLKITPEYEEYFINQDVWLKVNVVNNSNDSYYLRWPLNRSYTHFYGKSPSGKVVKDSLTIDEIQPADSLRLQPGSSYEKVMALNQKDGNFFGGESMETGTYKIYSQYQDLVSNELNVAFNIPSGIDKKLYDETYGKLFSKSVSAEERILKLSQLLKVYPASKYSPQLYNLYFRESNFTNDYNKSPEFISDFFEFNNDTYGADLILDIGNHNLEKLSSKYRDSKTGYLIRQRKKEALTHK